MSAFFGQTYLITFATGAADIGGLQRFIQYDPMVRAYWNYIPYVYCIKTDHNVSASAVALAIDRFFPDGLYVVTEVNAANMSGKLPKAAWDWFYAAPPNRLAGPLPPSPFAASKP